MHASSKKRGCAPCRASIPLPFPSIRGVARDRLAGRTVGPERSMESEGGEVHQDETRAEPPDRTGMVHRIGAGAPS
jgi:hypothetical protein